MRDNDHGSPFSRLTLDQPLHEVDGITIERRMRFVQQQERPINHQLPGELGATLHPVRGCTGEAIGSSGKTYSRKRLWDALIRNTRNATRKSRGARQPSSSS